MEEWSVRDDRPAYADREGRSAAWLVPGLAVFVVVAFAAAYAWWQWRGQLPAWSGAEPPAPQAAAEPVPPPAPAPAPAPQAAAPAPPEPLPEPAPQAGAKPLPALGESDPLARESAIELFGRKTFAALFVPEDLVRRVVATVDNLSRSSAPQRLMPVKPVPKAFIVAASGEQFVIAQANFARYAPYVRAFGAVDAAALVATYVRLYPLFQRAYRELGYPDGRFNDRVVAAIDDMLAAPEVRGPIRLMRPKVLYEFLDPDLETRSAGQKMLVRMGAENAAKVKAKLRQIRREIVAAGERKT